MLVASTPPPSATQRGASALIPHRPAPLTVLGFVVRTAGPAGLPTLGVAFRLVQASMDVLAVSRSD